MSEKVIILRRFQEPEPLKTTIRQFPIPPKSLPKMRPDATLQEPQWYISTPARKTACQPMM